MKPKQCIRSITREEWQIFSNLIWEELQRAQKKFPMWPKDYIHGAAVVGEEAGEILKAALQLIYEGGSVPDVIKETTHTAAMCLRYWITLSD